MLRVTRYVNRRWDQRLAEQRLSDLGIPRRRNPARYDARIASGFAAFLAASARSHRNACAAGLLIKPKSGGCNEHPSALGQRILAAAVAKAAGLLRR
jgi:hypothetical protein